MALTPEQRAELKALGPDTVRVKLIQPGAGRGAAISGFKTGILGGQLTRGDVEDWLVEQNIADQRLKRSTVIWARIGQGGAACIAIATIAATIWPQEIGHALIDAFVAARRLLGL